jgi:hypothetical protein
MFMSAALRCGCGTRGVPSLACEGENDILRSSLLVCRQTSNNETKTTPCPCDPMGCPTWAVKLPLNFASDKCTTRRLFHGKLIKGERISDPILLHTPTPTDRLSSPPLACRICDRVFGLRWCLLFPVRGRHSGTAHKARSVCANLLYIVWLAESFFLPERTTSTTNRY